MKKFILAAFVGITFMLVNGIAFAASEDLAFDVGIKAWANSMKLSFGGPDSTFKSENTVLMVGPSARMSYKKFFTGLSVLTTTGDYEFNTDSTAPDTATDKLSRTDIDLLAGIMFVPQFGIVTGYKGILIEDKYAGGKDKWNKNGGLFGVVSSYALPFEAVRLAFYGNLAYLVEHEKITGDSYAPGESNQHTYQGFAAEAGLAYNIVAGLSTSLGYKVQGLYSFKKTDETESITELYDGVTLGVNYRF